MSLTIMRKNIFMAVIALLAMAACSKENIEDKKQPEAGIRGIEVSANAPQTTKTTIDGVNVLWAKGDKVGFVADDESAVDGSSCYTITDEFDGKPSARITVPVKEGTEVTDETQIAFTAYYPYSEISSDGTQVIEIAAEQDGETGKWGQMEAEFSGTKAELVEKGLTFTHKCAYIDFRFKSSSLSGCPVTKVTLTSLDEDRHFTGKTILKADVPLTESYNHVSVSDPVARLSAEWQGKTAVVTPVDLTGTKVRIDITYTKDGAALTQTKVITGSNLQAGHKITLKLNLDKTDFNVISFEDEALGKALATAFGSDGCLTMAQAAEVTDTQMKDFAAQSWPKSSVSAFNEFQYFTGVTKTEAFAQKTIYEITLPNSVTEISDLSYFKVLKKINNTEHITRVGIYAFMVNATTGNTSLTSISLPAVTLIANCAFKGCSALESVTNTANLKTVYREAFRGCSSLKSIDLSNLQNASEKHSFAFCGNLESVDLRSLTSAGESMFQGCAKLTSVGSLRNLTKIADYMFKDCINLPAVDYLTENVGKYAFQNCSKLEITNEQLKMVKTIGEGGFDNCKKIAGEICLPQIESIGSSAFARSGITAIDLTGAPITEIGSYAFTNMSSLEKITISANVSKIRANAFQYSSSLSEIHLLSTTPATLDTNALKISDSSAYSGKIYVPKGCAAAYKSAEGWSAYAGQIQEEQ